ncbi:MAG TPA: transglutaminase-like domain-containing protein [Acidimicrobiia bacterium]|nr:transglutaminase-like domain-containing protein [Acidimicrobiia bacterium]
MQDPAERFANVVAPDRAAVHLDEAALCIAAHAREGLDVDEWCSRLDDLAGEARLPSFDEVRHVLFEEHDFRGDTAHYQDPENSFLDAVLTRERGIPISLSVVVIEVARRLGIPVHGVGMPGHFLVQDADSDGFWLDAFHGGALLQYEDCARIVDRIYRGTRRLVPSDLTPTPARAILARMLANLEGGSLASDPTQLAWMLRLHVMIPGTAVHARLQLLRQFAEVGHPAHVAQAYDLVVGQLDDDKAREQVDAEATRYRRRWN